MKNIKIAIVGSSYKKQITDNLEKNCIKILKEKGVKESQITSFRVPGSLEIPLAVKLLAKQEKYDAIIAFGMIHKGDTYHFELISNECIRGCMDVSREYEIPVIYEVLSVYNVKDALDRTISKGREAALTALEMIKVVSEIKH